MITRIVGIQLMQIVTEITQTVSARPVMIGLVGSLTLNVTTAFALQWISNMTMNPIWNHHLVEELLVDEKGSIEALILCFVWCKDE